MYVRNFVPGHSLPTKHRLSGEPSAAKREEDDLACDNPQNPLCQSRYGDRSEERRSSDESEEELRSSDENEEERRSSDENEEERRSSDESEEDGVKSDGYCNPRIPTCHFDPTGKKRSVRSFPVFSLSFFLGKMYLLDHVETTPPLPPPPRTPSGGWGGGTNFIPYFDLFACVFALRSIKLSLCFRHFARNDKAS